MTNDTDEMPDEYLEMLREREAEDHDDKPEERGDGMPKGSPPPEML